MTGHGLTVSPALYEIGLPANNPVRLHFATYGDVLFDRLLEHMGGLPVPDCVRRLEVSLEDATVIGYAVCVVQPDGGTRTVLVDDYRQLKGLELAESAVPDADELLYLEEALRRQAETMVSAFRAMSRIEGLNQQTARDQEVLDYLVMARLMAARLKIGQARRLFKEEAEAIERVYTGQSNRRDPVRINDLPAQIVSDFSTYLPYQVSSRLGEYFVIAPPLLIRAAVDMAWRVANTIRTKPLTTEAVIARLEREATRRYGQR